MKFAGVIAVTLVAAAAVALLPPVPQSPEYHWFADRRTIFGIANFFNVASNIPFLFAGLYGLVALFGLMPSPRSVFSTPSERWPYVLFFCAVLFTSLGSTYYHLAPDNGRLFWDRLPMTVLFMSFLSAMIAERVSARAGVLLLAPLVFLGIASVVYWYLGERAGAGDLRLYAFVQYYPLLVIPLMLLQFPPTYSRGSDIVIIFGFYAAAKGFELLDGPVFDASHIVSGHTLKHVMAAAAAFWVAHMLAKREPLAAMRQN
jgi:hypothetical protein